MTDFDNKVQNEITRVKGLKRVHTSGWFKFPFGTEGKLYLDDSMNKLENVGLQQYANCMS